MSADTAQTPADFLIECIIEARAKRDAINTRGFDSSKRRKELDAEVDEYLDDLNRLRDDG